jgi:hypothetical protein
MKASSRTKTPLTAAYPASATPRGKRAIKPFGPFD